MTGTRTRAGAATAGLLLMVVATLGGCAGSPFPATDSTGPAVPAATSAAAGATDARRYETDAESYARAAVRAWIVMDLGRIAGYVSPAAGQVMSDHPSPGDDWVFLGCTPSGGSTTCAFRNLNGDDLTLTVDDATLGHAGAVSTVDLRRTTFPREPKAYASMFLAAWQAGNKQLMSALTSTQVYDHVVEELTPPGTFKACVDQGVQNSTYVSVFGLGASADFRLTLRLSNSALGGPHAIFETSPVQAPC
jgi:hypothetical protein